MKKALIFIIILLTPIGCARWGYLKIYQIPPETPEEEEYLQNVWETPIDFNISNKSELITWGRIQSWIGKYSTLKIQVATDFVVQTYGAEYGQFGYHATRTPDVTETRFSIRCLTIPKPEKEFWSVDYDYSKQADLNAHILAYFALTGEVNPRFIKQ